ncbi:hypothetical protein F1880_007029 [Penicillium rolfsii]|nr:hypothetical protein F1880_007029 [Penicillium rolfsii]
MNGVEGKEVFDHEEMDCGFFCACMAARMVSRRAGNFQYPYPHPQMDGCSSNHRTRKFDEDLGVDYRESSRKGLENHEGEIDPAGGHLRCEMCQGRGGTRVMVATLWDSRNDGHLGATGGHLDHDADFCPGRDSILDLCDGPYPGGHCLDRRSSDLSEPDSYGTQP